MVVAKKYIQKKTTLKNKIKKIVGGSMLNNIEYSEYWLKKEIFKTKLGGRQERVKQLSLKGER